MNEAFLQYIWGQRLYRSAEQMTTDGRKVEILNPGRLNTDAGPDFFNAQVRIDGVTWAGNIEIHQTSDDWFRHGHDKDSAYENVILHVVGRTTGRPVTTCLGSVVPEVVISYDQELENRYDALENGGAKSSVIRCADLLSLMPETLKTSWLDSLLIERMEMKSDLVLGYVEHFNGDIDQAFFAILARSLGCKVNAEPMEMLVRATPLRILLKHNGVLQTEALLLGLAGLLAEAQADDYVIALRREYELLKAKFNIEPISGSVWKYARLRPLNFPDIRLVQLAAIVRAIPGNFASCLSLPLDKLLAVAPSAYWERHYRLGVEAKNELPKAIGANTRRLIMINAVIPFAFAMGRRFDNAERKMAAIDALRNIEIEKNSVLERWASFGIKVKDEAEAQAVLHLTKAYCERSGCLRCRFGHFCISHGVTPVPYASIVR